MDIRSVIETFGGITALARDLGHRNPSTVQGWWDRELIPAHRQRAVLDLARVKGLLITAEDLIPSCRSVAA